MLEIRDVPEMGLHISHMADDCLGNAIPFFPVFQGQGMIDHFLKMTSVFRNVQMRTFGIVLEVFYCIQM